MIHELMKYIVSSLLSSLAFFIQCERCCDTVHYKSWCDHKLDTLKIVTFNSYHLPKPFFHFCWDNYLWFQPQKHQRGDASLREKLLGHRDEAYKNNIQSGVTIPVPSSPIQVNTEVFWQRHGPISPNSDYYYV